MKAASLVQTHIQHEMTIAGLPLRLLFVSATFGVSALVIPLIARSLALAIPCGAIGIVGSWLFLVRRYRNDPFFDKQLLLAPRFWVKRKGKLTVLSAGGQSK